MATEILSVGIDIGTSTTQVIFSRLMMENTAGYFSVPHVSIVDKEVIYRGDIHTTPLVNQSLIDGDRVSQIVAGEFQKAGFSPKDTRTGAVIITGESARKENSAIVLQKLSGFAGDFVVSTAGPDLEAIIAGKGSGAQQYSEENHCTVVNLDIGGGTTNLAVFDRGEVIAKGCLDIGGRQIKLEPDLTVTYISSSAKRVALWRRVEIEVGQKTTTQALEAICEGMSLLLEQLLGLSDPTPLLREIQTPGSSWFDCPRPIDAISFSGGVADCIYRSDHPDPFVYGDIGVLLGKAIRQGRLCSSFRLISARETIRATVVGAGVYTTSVSGSTIEYTQGLLPLKNLPALKLTPEEERRCFAGDRQMLAQRMRWLLEQSESEHMILALRGLRNPGFQQLKTLAGCIAAAADEVFPPGQPVLVAVEADMAKALGQLLHNQLQGRRKVVAIDSVRIGQNDYLDLGAPVLNGLAIPVVVKTLILG